MKVYCSYNQELHNFLNKVVKLILNEYGPQLNLATLEEIELVNKNEFEYEKDGETVSNSKIIVTSRLYELLPTLNINQLKDNNYYKQLKQTIFHEMGHINDMVYMPNLYKYVLENSQKKTVNYIFMSSLFWIEYIAEKRSFGFEKLYDMEICDDFVEAKWECSMSSNFTHFYDDNFYYLTKILPYFLVKTRPEDVRQEYVFKIKNSLVKKYIEELDVELKYLESIGIFDDLGLLNNLCNIIKKYEKLFLNKFST